MQIERTDSEIIIKLSSSIDIQELRDVIDYITYKEATINSKATQDEVDELAREVNKNWWKENRSKFLK